eukprot:scaffold58647_cov42-Phaeocystis_antarctica.AAC.1
MDTDPKCSRLRSRHRGGNGRGVTMRRAGPGQRRLCLRHRRAADRARAPHREPPAAVTAPPRRTTAPPNHCHATRCSCCATVRTPYAYRPWVCRTFRVPWHLIVSHLPLSELPRACPTLAARDPDPDPDPDPERPQPPTLALTLTLANCRAQRPAARLPIPPTAALRHQVSHLPLSELPRAALTCRTVASLAEVRRAASLPHLRARITALPGRPLPHSLLPPPTPLDVELPNTAAPNDATPPNTCRSVSGSLRLQPPQPPQPPSSATLTLVATPSTHTNQARCRRSSFCQLSVCLSVSGEVSSSARLGGSALPAVEP